jgi:hypothetical protein
MGPVHPWGVNANGEGVNWEVEPRCRAVLEWVRGSGAADRGSMERWCAEGRCWDACPPHGGASEE